jgi:hypothetical protein
VLIKKKERGDKKKEKSVKKQKKERKTNPRFCTCCHSPNQEWLHRKKNYPFL